MLSAREKLSEIVLNTQRFWKTGLSQDRTSTVNPIKFVRITSKFSENRWLFTLKLTYQRGVLKAPTQQTKMEHRHGREVEVRPT